MCSACTLMKVDNRFLANHQGKIEVEVEVERNDREPIQTNRKIPTCKPS